jgi:hypothetical protein
MRLYCFNPRAKKAIRDLKVKREIPVPKEIKETRVAEAKEVIEERKGRKVIQDLPALDLLFKIKLATQMSFQGKPIPF